MAKRFMRMKGRQTPTLRPRLRPQRVEQLTPEETLRRWDEMHASDFYATRFSARESYLQSSWVYSAITILSDWMTRNPLVIENNGQVVTSGPVYKLVHEPNKYPQQNSDVKFRNAYMHELLLSGAVMRVFTAISGITPSQMAVFRRSDFIPSWRYDENGRQVVQSWQQVNGRHSTRISGDTIFHDALYNPFHDFEGLAPLTAAILGINVDISLGELLNRWFENDASTGLIMSTDRPVSEQQVEDAQMAWDTQNRGLKKAYRTKFIGYGFQPNQLQTELNARQQQVLKQLSRDEIMNGIFRIPPPIYAGQLPTEGVQIGSRSAEPEIETFVINVVMGWSDRFDAEFNRDVAPRFGPGYRIRHDYSTNAVLERRRLQRAKEASELIDRGVSLNKIIEWMRLELQPEPWGDEYWVKQGQVPASLIMSMGERAMNPGGRPASRSGEQYVQDIARNAQTNSVAEAARDEARRNGNRQVSNRIRIAEIMGHVD